jgi:hypothetical protein
LRCSQTQAAAIALPDQYQPPQVERFDQLGDDLQMPLRAVLFVFLGLVAAAEPGRSGTTTR